MPGLLDLIPTCLITFSQARWYKEVSLCVCVLDTYIPTHAVDGIGVNMIPPPPTRPPHGMTVPP